MLTVEQTNIIKEQDKALDRIDVVVKNIKSTSIDIKDELDKQNNNLDDIESDINKTSSKFERLNKKIKLVYKNSTKSDKLLYLILFVIIVILIIFFIYVVSI